ncbi:MAG: hypothetical protein Q8P39_00955 [Candidatus Yanofskybacteria bacterium]|nr:hypothetical protein [Candidatus Yanofskybacteria bacterium]
MRDYTPESLLLHIVKQMGRIAKALRREDQKDLLRALPRFYIWVVSFCVMYRIDLEEAVWNKYKGCCPYCGATEHCSCASNSTKPAQWYRNESVMRPRTVAEWQEMFRRIYGETNHTLSLTEIGLHLAEEVGEVSEAFYLRERDGEAPLHYEIADTIAWLFALANRLGIDLGALSWEAYPGVCDTCRMRECACPLV